MARLINLRAENIRNRYTLQGTPDPDSTAHILTAKEIADLANKPKTKDQQYSFQEAMQMISKLETEEAGTPMPRAAELVLHYQATHNRLASNHEKENAKGIELFEKKKEREGVKNEKTA